ncbi:MAG: hypothetical protein K6B70_05640 [Clostridia bacterium]|nr:hypothetical protein [Clostridia bacterium]
MKKKSIKISLVINIIVFILTVAASIIMFTGFKFMGNDVVLESTKIGMLKFFTVQSNIFMGLMALICAIKEISVLKGKIKDVPIILYVLKLISTVAVGLTFITVVAYLGPISVGGLPSMLKNSNLFFHLLIPVISMINFAIFEKTDKIKFKYTFLGLIPTVLYAIFYLINVLIHMENGKVSPIYDWYWFAQAGIWQICIVVPLMMFVTYFISIVLWRVNKKV